jgi:hypothetical protein
MTMRKPDQMFRNWPDSPLKLNRSLAAELKSNSETPFLQPSIPKFQPKLTIRAPITASCPKVILRDKKEREFFFSRRHQKPEKRNRSSADEHGQLNIFKAHQEVRSLAVQQ